MKVKAIKNTGLLVKGSIYDVLELSNKSTTGSTYWKPSVKIKIGENIRNLSAKNFTSTDGSDLPEINWKSNNIQKTFDYIKDVRNLKDELVVCKYGTTNLDAGKMYRVSDVQYKETKSITGYVKRDQKIKIEGYNRWLQPYRFRLCTVEEKRNLSLGSIFDEDVKYEKIDSSSRKIDRLSTKEKNRLILSLLLSSIIDPTRNNLSIVDWAIDKKGKTVKLKKEDINPFLNKKLSSIIKMIEDDI